MKRLYSIGFLFIFLIACNREDQETDKRFFALMGIPEGFPEMPEPEYNQFTEARWKLGKRLFFDPVMSKDSTISCASCHRPELAFSDNRAMSPGVENRPGKRNAPSLANVGYQPYYTREGGVPTLEMQVLVPIQEHNEFDFNIVKIADRLNRIPAYVELSQKAYSKLPDAQVISNGLAVFERSLISGNSPFDQWYYQNDETAVNEAAKRGWRLFSGERANCSSCHSGFNFSNYAFENNGLYEHYPDSGRMHLTYDPADRALFKVPSLRNVALTAPYMHDGSMRDLPGVIEHYSKGGKEHPHKSGLIKALNLSEREKDDLLQFLESLTDYSFANQKEFKNEK